MPEGKNQHRRCKREDTGHEDGNLVAASCIMQYAHKLRRNIA